uniref:Neuromast-expressed gpi-anchored lymphocyte antigen 6 n=1 Tax=Sphaeramia orbicularis TaxID=375764 RepID=A0A673AV23_9TELE
LHLCTALCVALYTLKCYDCGNFVDEHCSDIERECPSGSDRCLASRITQYTGKEISTTLSDKGCIPASHCVEASLNVGKYRTAFTTKCCTTDLCNDQLAPGNILYLLNGKKCIGCDGTGFCNWNVDCVDNEDHCFTNTVVNNIIIQGCASEEYCLKTQIAELPSHISTEMTCCQGDYCNRADSTGGSLLLLVVTVVSLVIFS